MEAIPQSFAKEPVFSQLGRKARYAALTEREKKAYNESLKAYRDAYAIAETERTEGRAEGRAEERIIIARNLLMAGQSVGLISSVTGLSETEIERLGCK